MNFRAFFAKRSPLRADNRRTRAADLTLRESLLPMCLVTILYFLWVSSSSPWMRSNASAAFASASNHDL